MAVTRDNAVLGSVNSNPTAREVTSWEPSSVFVAKSLLCPVTAVATLAACLWLNDESLRGPYFLVAVVAFIGVAELFDVAEVDCVGRGAHAIKSLLDILLRWAALSGFVWLLLYLSEFKTQTRDPALFAWFAVTPWVLWSAQLGVGYLLRLGNARTTPRNAIVIGLTEQGLRLDGTLRSQALLRTRSLGFFDDRDLNRLPPEGVDRVRGRISDVARYMRDHDVNVVYITLPMVSQPRILSLLEELRDSTASVYFVPDLLTLRLTQARFDAIHGIPLVAICESPFYGVSGMAKRLTDVLFASAILLALAPVFISVAVGVRLSSPGPIIFKQRRYGLDGREIQVYKFRSMTVTEDGEKSYTQVTRNDNRVTRFGAIMRRYSLDELPQFLNVLEGSMSVVGPRPHAIAVNEHYRRLIPSYMIRHKVKPGITGWAQINGYRGGDDLETMTKRIEFDLDYLSNWSLWFDLRIILLTAAVVWNDRRAF